MLSLRRRGEIPPPWQPRGEMPPRTTRRERSATTMRSPRRQLLHLKASPPPRPRARPGSASAERFEHWLRNGPRERPRRDPVSRSVTPVSDPVDAALPVMKYTEISSVMPYEVLFFMVRIYLHMEDYLHSGSTSMSGASPNAPYRMSSCAITTNVVRNRTCRASTRVTARHVKVMDLVSPTKV